MVRVASWDRIGNSNSKSNSNPNSKLSRIVNKLKHDSKMRSVQRVSTRRQQGLLIIYPFLKSCIFSKVEKSIQSLAPTLFVCHPQQKSTVAHIDAAAYMLLSGADGNFPL